MTNFSEKEIAQLKEGGNDVSLEGLVTRIAAISHCMTPCTYHSIKCHDLEGCPHFRGEGFSLEGCIPSFFREE